MSEPAVVCLHGLRRTPADWDRVRPGLERFGPLSAPALPARPREALDRADRAVGDGDLVIGHSMGGVLALRLAGERGRRPRALVLTGCFFPPARNGRTLLASLADYGGHRVAFVRAARRRSEGSSEGSVAALGLLVGQALSRRRDPVADGLPVLVVHARDDHHVPVDFARAAVARNPRWDARILVSGGHHAHVAEPTEWLAAVLPWLAGR